MFSLSEYILSKTKYGTNPNQLSTMSIVFGLICYGAIYFYFLAYYKDTLPFINQYLVYFIALDLIMSIFYYYKLYKNTEPTLISSFFDKQQNEQDGSEEAECIEEITDLKDRTHVNDDSSSSSDSTSENDNDNDSIATDITDILIQEELTELNQEPSNVEQEQDYEQEEQQQIEEQLQEAEQQHDLDQQINQTLEELQETAHSNTISTQTLLEDLAISTLPLPKKRGRKPKNTISI